MSRADGAYDLLDRRVMRVGLVRYGSIQTLTGGYLYDRRLLDHLVSRGIGPR
jgi:hypothetical protein